MSWPVRLLKPGGSMVLKLFHGEGFDAFVRKRTSKIWWRSSTKARGLEAQSRETYLIATDYRVIVVSKLRMAETEGTASKRV